MATRSRRLSCASVLGSSEPTLSVHPAHVSTEVGFCDEICTLGDLRMFDWQVGVVDGWLGRDARGMWASPTCGLAVPRQNGKSLGTVQARSNYGMVALGEQVVYTAHLQKTATETFESIAGFFTSRKMVGRVKAVREALGREQIVLKSGARIKFLARTRNGEASTATCSYSTRRRSSTTPSRARFCSRSQPRRTPRPSTRARRPTRTRPGPSSSASAPRRSAGGRGRRRGTSGVCPRSRRIRATGAYGPPRTRPSA